MTSQLFQANGVLVLDKVTPVIAAFFAPFNLDHSYPGSGEAFIEVTSTKGGPTWQDVYRHLPPLLETLSIDTRRLSEDDLPASLQLLAAHFDANTDPTLTEIFQTYRFEGDVHLEMMFRVVRRFDDGHGLRAIKLNSARSGASRQPFAFGGTGLFISDDFCLNTNSEDTLTLGEELSTAIQFDDLDLAAKRIARYAQSLLNCVAKPQTRRALHWRVADLLLVSYQDSTRRS